MPGDADHGILHTDNGSGLGSGATSSRPSQQRTGGMLHTTPASCSGTSLLGLPGQASPTLRHGVLAAAGPQQSSRGLADPAAGDTASASTIADMTHGPALAAVGSDQSHSGSFAFMPPSALFPPAPGVHPGPGPGPPAAGGDPER